MNYTRKHLDFIKEHGSLPRTEITSLFNAKFGVTQKLHCISNMCKKLGVKSLGDGRFQKGQTPPNKGTKGLTGANKTSFKQGNAPHNMKVVGDITKIQDTNGNFYLKIKIAEPNKWQMLHVHIWEKEHGKTPKGYCVIFKDKNTENMSLDNLMLVSRSELLRLNAKYSTIDPSLKEVALQVVKLQNEVIKTERQRSIRWHC